MTVGDKIKKIRQDKKISQIDLAHKLGVSSSMISQYESGKRQPKIETIYKIASALHVNPADIDDSLSVNLGSDITLRDSEGTLHTYSTTSEEFKLLSSYYTLTDDVREQVIRIVNALSQYPENRKDSGNGLKEV